MSTNIEPWKRGACLENYFSWKDCRCAGPRMPCSQNESWDPEILPTVMGKPKGKSPCEEGDMSDKHLKGPCVNCKKKNYFSTFVTSYEVSLYHYEKDGFFLSSAKFTKNEY